MKPFTATLVLFVTLAAPAAAQDPQSLTRAIAETASVQAVALALKKAEPSVCRWCSGPSWDVTPPWVDTSKADALSYATLSVTTALGAILPLLEPDDMSTKVQREVQFARVVAWTQLLTEAAKIATARERPDGSDALSFWSEHSAISAAAGAQAWKHGHRKTALFLDLPLALATGYLRTKGGKHHPLDVVTGLAAGATIGFVLP